MKPHHFAMVFFIIFLCMITELDLKSSATSHIIEEKKTIDESVNTAINDAVRHLVSVDGYENITVNKDEAVTRFLLSLYSNFDILSDRSRQEIVEQYIPVFVITVQEGYYCYYYEDVTNLSGETVSVRVWSELLPYLYEDEDFIYRFTLSDEIFLYDKKNLLANRNGPTIYQMDYREIKTDASYQSIVSDRSSSFLLDEEVFNLVRKRAILDCIEKSISYYTTRHNLVAATHGISYNFAFPGGGLEGWAEYLEDVSIIVVFQGYPYKNGIYTYNRVVSAGAYVKKVEKYLIEDKSWYLVYHREGCSLIKNNVHVRKEIYQSAFECVEQGCYACEECCYSGAYAPEIGK